MSEYPTADTVARAQAYHAILTDLIAELRDPGNYATRTVLADRAEARLREIGGGDADV